MDELKADPWSRAEGNRGAGGDGVDGRRVITTT